MKSLVKFPALVFAFLIVYNVAKADEPLIYKKKVNPPQKNENTKTTTPSVNKKSNSSSSNDIRSQNDSDRVPVCSWVRYCQPNRNKLTLQIKSSKPGACCRFYEGSRAYTTERRDNELRRVFDKSNTCQFEDGQTFVLDATDMVAPAKYRKSSSKRARKNGKEAIFAATDDGLKMTKPRWRLNYVKLVG